MRRCSRTFASFQREREVFTSLTINGVNETNLYVAASSYPAKMGGYWYISYVSAVSYGHFEAK